MRVSTSLCIVSIRHFITVYDVSVMRTILIFVINEMSFEKHFITVYDDSVMKTILTFVINEMSFEKQLMVHNILYHYSELTNINYGFWYHP